MIGIAVTCTRDHAAVQACLERHDAVEIRG